MRLNGSSSTLRHVIVAVGVLLLAGCGSSSADDAASVVPPTSTDQTETQHFLSLVRQGPRGDYDYVESIAEFIDRADSVVLARFVGATDGRTVYEAGEDADPLPWLTSVMFTIEVDEVISGQSELDGNTVFVEAFRGRDIDPADIAASLPVETPLLLGLTDYTDIADPDVRIRYGAEEQRSAVIWSTLPQGFVMRGGDGLPIGVLSPTDAIQPWSMEVQRFDEIVRAIRNEVRGAGSERSSTTVAG